MLPKILLSTTSTLPSHWPRALVAGPLRWLVATKKFFLDRFYWVALRITTGIYRMRKYWGERAVIRAVRREAIILPLRSEISCLMDLVERTAHIPGDIAEVGVYDGTTAKIIAHKKGDRTLHLFDTFSGLPEISSHDFELFFSKGQFACSHSMAEFKKAFANFQPVVTHKGIFPVDTGQAVANKQFSFVHLDVDLYESTRASLQFFYPRLHPGGVILSHDYLIASGVSKAFDEFFADKPEVVLPTVGTQCVVVKVAG